MLPFGELLRPTFSTNFFFGDEFGIARGRLIDSADVVGTQALHCLNVRPFTRYCGGTQHGFKGFKEPLITSQLRSELAAGAQNHLNLHLDARR